MVLDVASIVLACHNGRHRKAGIGRNVKARPPWRTGGRLGRDTAGIAQCATTRPMRDIARIARRRITPSIGGNATVFAGLNRRARLTRTRDKSRVGKRGLVDRADDYEHAAFAAGHFPAAPSNGRLRSLPGKRRPSPSEGRLPVHEGPLPRQASRRASALLTARRGVAPKDAPAFPHVRGIRDEPAFPKFAGRAGGVGP